LVVAPTASPDRVVIVAEISAGRLTPIEIDLTELEEA
jgi:hypothetical protein